MEELPDILLNITGDVGRAQGTTSDGVSWRVYAERDQPDRWRCELYVDGIQVADISVHERHMVDLTKDTQAICASLVHSAIRSARVRRHVSSPELQRRFE